MRTTNIDALAAQHLRRAQESRQRRSAETVYGGHEKTLRQTLLTLLHGESLAEHENPGEATLLVLGGRVRLSATSGSADAAAGDLVDIPEERHSLTALEDATVLLTVAKLQANAHV